MKSEEIKAKIDELRERLWPLEAEMRRLQCDHRDALSREWISANQVTRSDVQFSQGDGIPWHFTIQSFADWMRTNGCTKRWCEWNTTIYSTAEILAGRMDRNAPGLAEHLPEAPC